MKTTTINTLDGPTRVDWWEREDFKNRSTAIYGGESLSAYLEGVPLRELIPEQVIPIPDNSVLCDICNTKIEEFPVPVVWNRALCKECFEEIKKEGEEKNARA